jgi:phospholipase C
MVASPRRGADLDGDSTIMRGGLTRRTFLAEGTSAVAGATLAGRLLRSPRARSWWKPAARYVQPHASQLEALRVLGHTTMRMPGSVPNASLAVGTETMPEIEHVVVLMLENHSYDNILGMLGREPGQRPRGDGFKLARDGLPAATNPYPDGRLQRAFRMPTTCQLESKPSQEWTASHNQFDNGKNDGFVRTPISYRTTEIVGPVAMGYWTEDDLPLTYALAKVFPIADRWFSSCLAQTDPQRRYLIAATSQGMTDDIGTGPGNGVANSTLGVPAAHGTIFQRMTDAGISWLDFAQSIPTGTSMELYPANDGAFTQTNAVPISQFFTDVKAGKLPQFSLLDPDYGTQSQENPQNIAVGEGFLGQVIDALRNSPSWRKTLFILCYDEHGGYYDHVPPPVALAPDNIPPAVNPGQDTYDGFARYGFRVPSMLIGPYVKRGYVSHKVYDHTSILAFLERKWNLQSMTLRDANANDLTDMLDLSAMAAGKPIFPEVPKLVPAGDDAARLACSKSGPGTIPAPIPAQKVLLGAVRVKRKLREVAAVLHADRGTMSGLEVQLLRGHHVVAHKRVAELGYRARHVVLRLHERKFATGRYTLVVKQGSRVLARRAVSVR